MVCKNCGKALPSEGAVCKFCGAMMEQSQIQIQKETRDEKPFQPSLLSDRYGVNKQMIYTKKKEEKENKVLGVGLILGVLLFLILLVIIVNMGR